MFRPGLLAAAHGGVLYVDEVNLLPDHLVDVLLDVAGSGLNRVERDGVSHSHPARFVLVGSMNPEEGELRPQLLDRFGLSVPIKAPGGAHRAGRGRAPAPDPRRRGPGGGRRGRHRAARPAGCGHARRPARHGGRLRLPPGGERGRRGSARRPGAVPGRGRLRGLGGPLGGHVGRRGAGGRHRPGAPAAAPSLRSAHAQPRRAAGGTVRGPPVLRRRPAAARPSRPPPEPVDEALLAGLLDDEPRRRSRPRPRRLEPEPEIRLRPRRRPGAAGTCGPTPSTRRPRLPPRARRGGDAGRRPCPPPWACGAETTDRRAAA